MYFESKTPDKVSGYNVSKILFLYFYILYTQNIFQFSILLFRNFYDILNCQTQFDFFKRFLVREKAETPLLFWTAVESMRTTSKNGKARQGRAHGIVKRYFGPSADYGESKVVLFLLTIITQCISVDRGL